MRLYAWLLMDNHHHLLTVTRYIHLNPIKTAACRRLGKAERVRRLEGYRWSSYRGYVHACVMEDDEPLLEAMRASRYAIGEAGFIEDTEQRLGELRTGRVQDDLAVELSCMRTGESGRTVGLHYGGISTSAVANIRRTVREAHFDIRSDLDHLLSHIRTAHIESIANGQKVQSASLTPISK
ncbi:MAG: hypothetical protein EA424_16395 [Planctomycetaceae bacterium]|nr:MAG: hypothetical protein EA424_16395 [Planctomycetaceae bacterium]